MRSLRLRLTISHLLVALLALALIAFLSPYLFLRYYETAERQRLVAAVGGVANAAGHLWHNPPEGGGLSLLVRTSGAVIGGEVALLSAGGDRVLIASGGGPATGAWAVDAYSAHSGKTTGLTFERTGAGVFLLTAPVIVHGRQVAALVVRRRDNSLSSILHAQRLMTAAAAGLASLLAIILALGVSRAISAPLVSMSRAAQRLAGGDFSVTLREAGPREIAAMAGSMNRMAASLAGAFAELAEERQLLADLLASMEEGVIGLDGEGCIITVNEAAGKLLGKPTVLGARLDRLTEADWVAEAVAVAGGQPGFSTRAPQGQRTLQVSVSPVRGRGAVVVLADITEAYRMEQLRREFVANASHELRAPLTSIRGFLGAILDGTASGEEETRQCLSTAAAEAARMTRIVEELLQLSRLQAGVVAFQFMPVDLTEVAEGMVASFAARLKAKQVTVNLETEPVPRLELDGDRLAQVIVNLLDNALRYSPEGGEITLRISSAPNGGQSAAGVGERGAVVLTVSDQGPGIPENDLEAIWERFHKADPSRPRTDPGAGLGLAIAREIVQRHGGEVLARNRPEGGAEVGFTLPLLA